VVVASDLGWVGTFGRVGGVLAALPHPARTSAATTAATRTRTFMVDPRSGRVSTTHPRHRAKRAPAPPPLNRRASSPAARCRSPRMAPAQVASDESGRWWQASMSFGGRHVKGCCMDHSRRFLDTGHHLQRPAAGLRRRPGRGRALHPAATKCSGSVGGVGPHPVGDDSSQTNKRRT